MSPLIKSFIPYFAVLILLNSKPVLAWGIEGHQVIAKIAQSSLSSKASTEVNKLLSLEPDATLSVSQLGLTNTNQKQRHPGITLIFRVIHAVM